MWLIGRMLAWCAQGLESVSDTKTKRKTIIRKRYILNYFSMVVVPVLPPGGENTDPALPRQALPAGCRTSQWLYLQFTAEPASQSSRSEPPGADTTGVLTHCPVLEDVTLPTICPWHAAKEVFARSREELKPVTLSEGVLA